MEILDSNRNTSLYKTEDRGLVAGDKVIETEAEIRLSRMGQWPVSQLKLEGASSLSRAKARL